MGVFPRVKAEGRRAQTEGLALLELGDELLLQDRPLEEVPDLEGLFRRGFQRLLQEVELAAELRHFPFQRHHSVDVLLEEVLLCPVFRTQLTAQAVEPLAGVVTHPSQVLFQCAHFLRR